MEYPAAGSGRYMGYRMTVQRLSPELLDYYFSTHMWIGRLISTRWRSIWTGCRGSWEVVRGGFRGGGGGSGEL